MRRLSRLERLVLEVLVDNGAPMLRAEISRALNYTVSRYQIKEACEVLYWRLYCERVLHYPYSYSRSFYALREKGLTVLEDTEQ